MKSHNSGNTSVVTVAATATLVKGFDVDIAPRIDLSLYNDSSQTIYLGYNSSVTTSNGFPLAPGEKDNESGYHGNVYAIVASSTANLRVRWK